jgi:hypothetical protein
LTANYSYDSNGERLADQPDVIVGAALPALPPGELHRFHSQEPVAFFAGQSTVYHYVADALLPPYDEPTAADGR